MNATNGFLGEFANVGADRIGKPRDRWRRGGPEGAIRRADLSKYVETGLVDWRVIRLTDAQITAPTIERLIAWIGTDTSRKV